MFLTITDSVALARRRALRDGFLFFMEYKCYNHRMKKTAVRSNSSNLQIEGGRKLHGTIETNSSKNGAVVLLCASLLNRGTTTLKRMPKIEEVNRLIEVLQSIGMKITWKNRDLHIIPPKKYDLKNINVVSAKKTRSIIMFVGPLAHLFKKFSIPQSGGCKLGSRTIYPHLLALKKLGITIETREQSFVVTNKKLHSAEIILSEAGDTATVNTLLVASKIKGTTTIKYASANYQVQEVCFFLQKLGVSINGIGTSTLIVKGVSEINKPIEYTVSEDPGDAMFFITAAILTKSAITITRCPIEFLEMELGTLKQMNFRCQQSKTYFSHNGHTKLVDIKTFPSKLIAPTDKIHSLPYPGLNIDNLPFFAIIATQAKGQTLIHDWVYEKRAIYYADIDRFGATTVLADPHRFFVTGPTKLTPAELVCPPALRPATIILIAMLGAEGTSILRNTYSINRGYEDLVNRLNSLGAKVRILEE
ncbi:MAG: UDP-N-acetylglucosamine 1-carboxyvinyltransferase [bacterium]|nr:UDP-N-acetylglucosamine 1-carboxyvinyltransferase [bacterium]